MRPLAIFSSLILVASTGLLASACSSHDTQLQSGGVFFDLQNASDPTILAQGTCPDVGPFTIAGAPATTGGAPLLLSDGEDGAHVSCSVSGSSFNATVSFGGNSFFAGGSVTVTGSTATSSDATVGVTLAGANSYKNPASEPCIVDFDSYDASHGSIDGEITCPELLNQSIAGICSLSGNGASHSYFTFSSCATS